MSLKLLLAALVVAAIPAFPQVAPQATRAGLPLTVGVGYSNFHTDYSGRLSGPMFWADWNFSDRLSFLRGLGIEVEARDLNYDRTGTDRNLRMDTAEGGVIYTYRRYRRVQPFAKCLIGFGSIDFNLAIPSFAYYTHDTRTVYAPGGGVNWIAFGNVEIQGNYEYQFWPVLFHGHSLNPNGITIGIAYDLRGRRGR
jgi:opacity protein-like surface antigen